MQVGFVNAPGLRSVFFLHKSDQVTAEGLMEADLVVAVLPKKSQPVEIMVPFEGAVLCCRQLAADGIVCRNGLVHGPLA